MLNPNFTLFPILKTTRLLLRQLTLIDEKEIFEIRSSEKIAKYLDRPLCRSIDDARAFINKINKGIENNEWIYWAICEKEIFKLIGTICIWNISLKESKAEIGFELLPQYHGKGIMQEALKCVLDYGFNVLQLNSMEGEVDPANIKSIKLMEKYNFKRRNNIHEYDSKNEIESKTVIYQLDNFYK